MTTTYTHKPRITGFHEEEMEMLLALAGNALTLSKGHGNWLVWENFNTDELQTLVRKLAHAYLHLS